MGDMSPLDNFFIEVCRVEDRQGSVQWTKDGFGLDVGRDMTGFPRYRMIGSDVSGIGQITDRQIDWLMDRQINRLIDIQIYRQTGRQLD